MTGRFDVQGELPPAAAVDFGASNTDAVAVVDGRLMTWTEPQRGTPDAADVLRVLAAVGLRPAHLETIAVTGGHHRSLPDVIEGTPVVKVGELEAIGRGGQALAGGGWLRPEVRLLVVSAGSGTAMVAAHGPTMRHVTGSGVGGGTLVGLSRLLLDTVDPVTINRLAESGDDAVVDLELRDVVTGPIGSLPPDTTAVNFGRLARVSAPVRREDLAAALVTLVAQVIGTIAVNAGRAAQAERIIVTGHLTDMAAIRREMARVGDFFGFPLEIRADAGSATVVGALLQSLGR